MPDQRGYNRSDKPAGLSEYRLDKLVADGVGLIDALGHERVQLGVLRATSAPGAFPEEEMNQYRAAWDREGAIGTMGDWYRAEAWPLEGSGLVRRRSKLKPPGTGNPDRAVLKLLFEGAI